MTWIPDKETYNEIQQLKEFLHLVANLSCTSAEDKCNVAEVERLIENIDKPETHQDWCIRFYMYDRERKYRQLKINAAEYRKWIVYFEPGELFIESVSEYSESWQYNDDFRYLRIIRFQDIEEVRQLGEANIAEFVADAKKYQSYITEHFNDIDSYIEID